MIDYQAIIDRYFPAEENPRLREILTVHSRSVAEKALSVCRNHPELHANEDFVYAAAMLHDIGIVKCDANGISCFGTEPYICHGTLGAEMLRECGVDESYSRVCARHTGTGLTAHAIKKQNLPLPAEDLLPETIEEQIICYADKFFSKTRLDTEKTYEGAMRSLAKFGEEGLKVFDRWHKKFS